MAGRPVIDSARLAVVGMGTTGTAVYDAVRDLDLEVSTWDSRGDDIGARLLSPDALLEWKPDLVVIAPGIPATGEIHQALKAAQIRTWSEIELAWHMRVPRSDGTYAPWLALTGTNGKTTTVSMTSAILEAASLNAPAVGNVGNPLITQVTDPSVDAFVLELSSFQLHTTSTMSPWASGCLNIADDHLDWHGGAQQYWADKARVYHNTQKACFYPVGDSKVQAMVDEADVVDGARAIGLTMGMPSPGMIGLVEDVVAERAFGPERFRAAYELFELSDLAHLSGGQVAPHIVADALMASGFARSLNIQPVIIRDALRAFQPGQHRIHTVREGQTTWIDDSKATNAHAARASLLSRPDSSVVWIAGGVAKGAQFMDLVAEVAPKLRSMIIIGTDQEPWVEAHAKHASGVPITLIDPSSDTVMTDAVAQAQRDARPGDTVMLAPACASWDQFASYADRGDQFAAAVAVME